MWLDADGRVHSVAAPDSPIEIQLSEETTATLGRHLIASAIEEVLDRIDDESGSELDEFDFDERREAEYVGQLPPPHEFTLHGRTPQEIASSLYEQLSSISLRWRLDYAEAIRDWLD